MLSPCSVRLTGGSPCCEYWVCLNSSLNSRFCHLLIVWQSIFKMKPLCFSELCFSFCYSQHSWTKWKYQFPRFHSDGNAIPRNFRYFSCFPLWLLSPLFGCLVSYSLSQTCFLATVRSPDTKQGRIQNLKSWLNLLGSHCLYRVRVVIFVSKYYDLPINFRWSSRCSSLFPN